jgi:hypothetical protein
VNDFSLLEEIPDPVQAPPGEPPKPPALSQVAPDRAQVRRRRQGALGLSLTWLVCHLAVFGVRQDLQQLPSPYLAAQVGLPLLLSLASLYVATRPGRFGLGLDWMAVAALAVFGPLAFWVVGVVMPPPHAAAKDLHPWLGALACSDIMLAWMFVPLFAAAIAWRGAFAAAAAWRSALIGAAVGLLSGATINLHCQNTHPFHLVIGHGVPVLLGALVGGLVVKRWMRA